MTAECAEIAEICPPDTTALKLSETSCSLFVYKVIDDATDSAGQDRCVEVDQQADVTPRQTKIRDQLREVDGCKTLYGLDLDNYAIIDYEIQAVPAVETDVFVGHGQ